VNKDLIKIINHFGKDHQIVKVIEELSELVVCIAKYSNNPSTFNKHRIIDEMSDSLIMLEQLSLILSIKQEQIDSIKFSKIERTLNLIES